MLEQRKGILAHPLLGVGAEHAQSLLRYQSLLQKSSMKDGIEIEIQRTRWEILKMMYNMKSPEVSRFVQPAGNSNQSLKR